MYGDTSDISVFRFAWFCPIWYYDPVSFPHTKMKKGFFLNVAFSVGDAFTYVIMPEAQLKRSRPITLVRSVIRRRDVHDDANAPRVEQSDEGLKFYDINGTELAGDIDLRHSEDSAFENEDAVIPSITTA